MKPIRAMYHWMGKKAHSPYAFAWFGLLLFLEASCFFIPADPLVVVFCLEHRKRAIFYGFCGALFSVLGGLFGYFIGAMLWTTLGPFILKYIISQTTFTGLVQKYEKYEAFAVFIGGLTPIPYKAITLSAGFCRLSLIPFICCSLIARMIRFMGIALLIYKWGAHIKDFIDQYFTQLVLLFLALVIGSCLLLKYF